MGRWFHQMNAITQVEQEPNYGVSSKVAKREKRKREERQKKEDKSREQRVYPDSCLAY